MDRPATALVFDFDGTIVDTETSVYESWAAAYRFAGAEPITLAVWLQTIGMADDSALDTRGQLCRHLGVQTLPDEVEAHRLVVRDDMLRDAPIRPGVIAWIEAATAASVPLAIASSSPSTWVRPHLARLGLDGHFGVVSCADPGVPGKPNPTVYQRACEGLGVVASLALAIEDSTHGVSAAIAAGMQCIAAPGPMTTTMEFDHATVRVDSLAELRPADWLS